MSTIIASFTTPHAEGITRNTLLERVLRETGLGTYGTATGGTVGTIIDTNELQSTQYNTLEYVGGWARIGQSSDNLAPENETRPITTNAPSTGTISVNPDFTVAPASGEKYQLWKKPNPRKVLDLVDEVLTEELYFPCWTMLSEVPDYDMEQSHTTDWTASNTTLTKQTGEPKLAGRRWLRVVTTSALGYARSA